MTPLSRFFEHYLPAWLALAALAVTYALMLVAIVFSDQPPSQQQIIYIDVRS